MRRSPVIERLEREHDKPLQDILCPYAQQNYSRTEAAEMLGVHVQTLRHAEHRRGLDIGWPPVNKSISRHNSYQRLGKKIRELRLHDPRTILIEDGGKKVSLKEAAERRGLNQRTVWDRWRAGIRPPELWRAPHKTMGKPPDMYHLGLSMDDWQIILDYAEERGADAAHKKFCIPTGAIKAMQKGEFEKVA